MTRQSRPPCQLPLCTNTSSSTHTSGFMGGFLQPINREGKNLGCFTDGLLLSCSHFRDGSKRQSERASLLVGRSMSSTLGQPLWWREMWSELQIYVAAWAVDKCPRYWPRAWKIRTDDQGQGDPGKCYVCWPMGMGKKCPCLCVSQCSPETIHQRGDIQQPGRQTDSSCGCQPASLLGHPKNDTVEP